MVEWLLKYPPEWYAAGSLGIAWSWQTYALVLVAVVIVLLWLPGYRRVRRGAAPLMLRIVLATVVLFALAEPTLVVEAPGPAIGHVAVLLDDSLSMRISDGTGGTPAERAAALIATGSPGDEGPLRQALNERVEARYFRFGEVVRPLAAGERLRHGDARSELGAALSELARGHDASSLAAVVLVSDGAQTPGPGAGEALDAALQTLRAAAVPVHVVDIRGEPSGPDLAVRAFRIPRTLLADDRVAADIEIAQHGLGGRRAVLIIEEDGLIVDRHELTLSDDRPVRTLRRRLRFATPGSRLLTAHLTIEEEEINQENNMMETTIHVTDEPLRVLHFEAEPRFETKFVRRAVARDPAIRLTSLVRTADNKYYRVGVEEADELAQGFPEDPAELFRYHALILGSMPAAMLTPAQQEAISDFVARRGGGLLLLGGGQAFTEGGNARAPLGDLAPAVPGEADAPFRENVRVRLSAAGRSDPLLDFDTDEPREALFERLPPLTVTHPQRRAKPGATVLLEGRDRNGEPLILLAVQRYGLGRVMSFPVRNSWRWQMHASMPLADQTHEMLWRQLLRDLGRGAGGRIRLAPMEVETTPGRPVTVRAQALNARFQPLAQASLDLRITTPLGEIRHQPLTMSALGGYEGQFVPRETGRYELVVELKENGTIAASGRDHVDVSAAGREFHPPADADRLLAGIAATTGGQVFEADDVERLARVIGQARGRDTVLRRLPLWDAPLLLLSILVLACAEWGLRRWKRLA